MSDVKAFQYRVIKCHKTGLFFPERSELYDRGMYCFRNYYNDFDFYKTIKDNAKEREVLRFKTKEEAEKFIEEEKKKDQPYDVVAVR